MYGAWRSREHSSVTGSDPIYTSVNVHALAWQLVYFAELSRLRPITRMEGRTYEGVRAGAIRWSPTMRAMPPASETAVATRDFDTAN
ncbi:hypothetical protein ACWEQV_20970 [Rhodococcus aetherivorans]